MTNFEPETQLVSILYADSSRVSLVYDSVGNRTEMDDSTGTTTYSFDALNRLSGKTDPGSLVQLYSFDPVRNKAKLVDPDGGIRTMAYDALDRISTLTDDGGTVSTYTWDAAGRRTSVGQSSPTWLTNWGYYAAANIVSITHYDANSALQSSFAFGYDNDNYRFSISDKNGSVATYSMDKKHRLTQDATSGTNAHTYNYSMDGTIIVSNSESGVNVSFSYNAFDQVVTSVDNSGTTTYTFDLNGSLTGVNTPSGRTTMSYDKENRLSVHLASDGTVSTYQYSGEGLKRVENVQGAITTLIWDGTNYLEGRS